MKIMKMGLRHMGASRIFGYDGAKFKDISHQIMTVRFSHYIHILQLVGAIAHEQILQPFIFLLIDKIKSLQSHVSIMSAVFPTRIILMVVNSWLRIELRVPVSEFLCGQS